MKASVAKRAAAEGGVSQGRIGSAIQKAKADPETESQLSTEAIIRRNTQDLMRLQRTWEELESVQRKLQNLRTALDESGLLSSEHDSQTGDASSTSSSVRKPTAQSTKMRPKIYEVDDSTSEISDVPSGIFRPADDEATRKILRDYYKYRRERSVSDTPSVASSARSGQSGSSRVSQTRNAPRPQSRFGPRPPSRKSQYANTLDDDSSVSLSNLSDDLKQGLLSASVAPARDELAFVQHGRATPQYRQESRGVDSVTRAPENTSKRTTLPQTQTQTQIQRQQTAKPSYPQEAPKQTYRAPFVQSPFSDAESSFASTDFGDASTANSVATTEIDMKDLKLAVQYSRTLPEDKRHAFFEEFAQYFRGFEDAAFSSTQSRADDSYSYATSERSASRSSIVPPTTQQRRVVQKVMETIPSPLDFKLFIERNSRNEATLVSVVETLRKVESGHLRKAAEGMLFSTRSPAKKPMPLSIENASRRSPNPNELPTASAPVPAKAATSTVTKAGKLQAPTPKVLPENYFLLNLELESPNRIPDESSTSESEQQDESESRIENEIDEYFSKYNDEAIDGDSYSAESLHDVTHGPEQPYDYSETADTVSSIATALTDLSSNASSSYKESYGKDEEESIETTSTAVLDREYTEEIEENEIIIHTLKASIDDLLEEGIVTYSRHHLYQLCELVIDGLSHKSLGRTIPDSHLVTSLRKLLFQYANENIAQTQTDLVQKVSDILYDEMIYMKVVQQVNKSYEKEIEDLKSTQEVLANEVGTLIVQRELDMKKLQTERTRRLNQPEEKTVEQPAKPTAPTKEKPRIATDGAVQGSETDDYEVDEAEQTELEIHSVEELPNKVGRAPVKVNHSGLMHTKTQTGRS